MDEIVSTTHLVQSIGWALVHFLWQGAAIGITIAVALRLLAGGTPTTRYAVACAGLLMMLLSPFVMVLASDGASAPGEPTVNAPFDGVPSVTTGNGSLPASPGRVPSRAFGVERVLPLAVMVWVVGVVVLSARLVAACLGLERLRRATREVDEALSARVVALSRRVGLARAVRVLESAVVQVPMVVGGLRPVILLPASVITSLPVPYLDAVIAHELAHVRRHDSLVNMVQVIAETLLFYHPAVWWCSQQIRIEREHCCDDAAVEACADRIGYARALAMLEERRGQQAALSLAVTGGNLVDRIRRLLTVPAVAERPSPAWVVVAALASVLSAAVAGPALWPYHTVILSAQAPEAVPAPRAVQSPDVAGPRSPALPPAAPQPRPAPPARAVPPLPPTPPDWPSRWSAAPDALPPIPPVEINWNDLERIFEEEVTRAWNAVPQPPDPPDTPAVARQDGVAQIDRARAQLERALEQLASARLNLAKQQEQLRLHEMQVEQQKRALRLAEEQLGRARDAGSDREKRMDEMRKVLEEMRRKHEAAITGQLDIMQLREQLDALSKELEALRAR